MEGSGLRVCEERKRPSRHGIVQARQTMSLPVMTGGHWHHWALGANEIDMRSMSLYDWGTMNIQFEQDQVQATRISRVLAGEVRTPPANINSVVVWTLRRHPCNKQWSMF